MHILRQAVLAVLLIALSGCSYFFGDEGQFREKSLDYQEAKSIEPLRVPDGVQTKPTKQRYPIPNVVANNAFIPKDSGSVPRPRTLANLDQDAGLELRKDDQLYWLIAERDSAELWPQLVEFVESNSFVVDVNNPEAGILETDWLKPRLLENDRGVWKSFKRLFTGAGSQELRDKFRIQVTSGKRAEGNIISINHVRNKLPLPEQVEWPVIPDDPDLVHIVYEEMMEFLSDDARRQGTSVLSQDLKSVPKYTMTRDGNDYPVLVINLDFNHAWLEVGQALALSKIAVKDLNRSLGIYYLARTVMVKDEDGDEAAKELQLRVIRSESGIQVAVQLDDDTIAPKVESTQILNALREKLQ
ncbi:outer membrane protein assembly factor BamC [Ketobacter sp. MCCC 1A13808]|uniref:outer membrane protein assembly factor BamC n=1 Tax=Ketobacter sp. MCCC 1A13808 TaxID=2602738 RepID=UPI0012EBA209|nr:outer membrane protein assembly factor BamC [Ketobacter sp. MCCC 1A13808]MVF10734.1 outer membrane protein assembly factor BamC [Ketobacter sp. MCCC 1A13808]